MHVIIIGAGEVGGYLAQRLVAENIDVAVIDTDPRVVARLGAELDIQGVVGTGSSIAVLKEAGVERATLVAAVTPSDEVNLIASLLSKENSVETTIVRVENEALRTTDCKKLLAAVGADIVIDPDAETAKEILELVHTTGVDEVYPMANGELSLIGAVLPDGAPLANHGLGEIGQHLGEDRNFMFGAITRDDITMIPDGDHILLPGDHVRVLCKKRAQPELLKLLGVSGSRARRVMILGGGKIGAHLAESLEDEGVQVTIIEKEAERAAELSNKFFHTMVIQGDITNTKLLREESIGTVDAVVGASGEDSANVLACAFATGEGAPFTVAVLHSLTLLPLVKRFGIDAALSPRTSSANAVLNILRGGATSVTTFLESDSEVDEILIAAESKADGAQISELELPDGLIIGAVIRPEQPAMIARGSTTLEAFDRIVVFGSAAAMSAAKSLFHHESTR